MSHQIGYFFEKHLFFFQTTVLKPGFKSKSDTSYGLVCTNRSVSSKKNASQLLSRKADIDAWRSFIASSTVHSTLALRLML